MDADRYAGSEAHMERARRVLTRGVGSALRAAQRPTPLAIAHASGSRLVDVDGNAYIDYVLGFGPVLLGHRPPAVVRAVEAQLRRGILYGAQHQGELELAEQLVELIPSAELVAFSSSGSEAIKAALRFARAATGRRLVIKFDGHYHGWLDPVHVSGPALPPSSETGGPRHVVPGLPAPADLLTCRWNDLGALTRLVEEHDGAVAAVVMEPVPCNFGAYEPLPGYLEGVRELCDRHGVVLIFDEVITGFRLARGGAQERYGVLADLTILGKIVGGGLPAAAYGGAPALMELVAPAGGVYQAGTLSGNPLATAAALATLEQLEPDAYSQLEHTTTLLADGLREAAAQEGVPLQVQAVTGLVTPFFSKDSVADYSGATGCDLAAYGRWCRALLREGIYPPPSQFEAWFPSLAHTEEDVERTVRAARIAFAELAS